MKSTGKQFAGYILDNYIGNFLGFVVGFTSTRLVSYFFTTRSFKNLWGLTARKTVVDKQTFSGMEWAVSIIIGFIVFEVISKWAKKKTGPWLNKYSGYLPEAISKKDAVVAPAVTGQSQETGEVKSI